MCKIITPTINTDILIAHPGKHHVLHLGAGCIKAGVKTTLVTPLYKKGLGKIISSLPGSIGQRANGYWHNDIPTTAVISPLYWQIKKLWSLFRKSSKYENEFDCFVASNIRNGKYTTKILVTLQDYMPQSVFAAQKKGIKIWSDQIMNQSSEVKERITRHEKEFNSKSNYHFENKNNIKIIEASTLITTPSTYCLNSFQKYIKNETKVKLVPYGGSTSNKKNAIKPGNEIIIFARTPSISKGGHLLLKALETVGDTLLTLTKPKSIHVVILGNLSSDLLPLLNKLKISLSIKISHGSIPHLKVHETLSKASLFVMPSLTESMSLACIEALHAKLPLIITPYCGIDGFENDRMGYLIKDDVNELCDALINAFKNSSQWDNWGNNSLNLAEQLTWNKYEARIAKLIEVFSL